MDKGDDEHQFFAGSPIDNANTFNGHFGFIKTDRDLNGPAAIVSKMMRQAY